MTTEQFLNIKIPVHAYNSISRGSSTKYSESFHIKGIDDKQLNIHYCPIRELITICLFDPSKDKWNTLTEIYRKKSLCPSQIPFNLIN